MYTLSRIQEPEPRSPLRLALKWQGHLGHEFVSSFVGGSDSSDRWENAGFWCPLLQPLGKTTVALSVLVEDSTWLRLSDKLNTKISLIRLDTTKK